MLLGPAIEDNQITVLNPAELVQAAVEGIQQVSIQLPQTGCHEADARDLASTRGRLWTQQHARPGEQKVAPSHRITQIMGNRIFPAISAA